MTPAVLATLPVVLYEAGGNTRRVVDEWFARAGIALTPVMDLRRDKTLTRGLQETVRALRRLG